MKVTRHKLEVDYEYNFLMIGISCHEKPYRMAWAINEALELELEKTNPHLLSLKKAEPPVAFSQFVYELPDHEASFILIANKSEGSYLIPEMPAADYFLLVHGPYDNENNAMFMQKIRNIPFVLTTFTINPDQLKSKQNLVF
jgi:hypothetical protein